jgi:hypothetical protein
MKRHDDAPVSTVIDNRDAWKFAIKYDLTIAQAKGLIALYGTDLSKLVAAAKRLTAKE